MVATDEASKKTSAEFYRQGLQSYEPMRDSDGFGFTGGDLQADQRAS